MVTLRTATDHSNTLSPLKPVKPGDESSPVSSRYQAKDRIYRYTDPNVLWRDEPNVVLKARDEPCNRNVIILQWTPPDGNIEDYVDTLGKSSRKVSSGVELATDPSQLYLIAQDEGSARDALAVISKDGIFCGSWAGFFGQAVATAEKPPDQTLGPKPKSRRAWGLVLLSGLSLLSAGIWFFSQRSVQSDTINATVQLVQIRKLTVERGRLYWDVSGGKQVRLQPPPAKGQSDRVTDYGSREVTPDTVYKLTVIPADAREAPMERCIDSSGRRTPCGN